ncbi:hypothetical protein PR048_000271 [Dryococelus australis]|uniref:Uncharacterized protein n=1 Tax=Dryococelus australis TaxID=614101 RepID=A0ABQ9IE64_9NEOP|nr:hypothetical protein PR048_000271 [Dryococelus australis]
MGDPRDNPPTSGIIRNDSHMRKPREAPHQGIEPGSPWWEASSQNHHTIAAPLRLCCDPAGNRTRLASVCDENSWVENEQCKRLRGCATPLRSVFDSQRVQPNISMLGGTWRTLTTTRRLYRGIAVGIVLALGVCQIFTRFALSGVPDNNGQLKGFLSDKGGKEKPALSLKRYSTGIDEMFARTDYLTPLALPGIRTQTLPHSRPAAHQPTAPREVRPTVTTSQRRLIHFGATVAERLECSPPAKANRVQSPAGSLTEFSVGQCRVFSGISRLSPPLHSGVAAFLPRFNPIGSQDLAIVLGHAIEYTETKRCGGSFSLRVPTLLLAIGGALGTDLVFDWLLRATICPVYTGAAGWRDAGSNGAVYCTHLRDIHICRSGHLGEWMRRDDKEGGGERHSEMKTGGGNGRAPRKTPNSALSGIETQTLQCCFRHLTGRREIADAGWRDVYCELRFVPRFSLAAQQSTNVTTETLHAMRVGATRRYKCVLVSPLSLLRFLTLDAQLHAALLRFAYMRRRNILERIERSPHTKANRVWFPSKPLSDFRMWGTCRGDAADQRIFSGIQLHLVLPSSALNLVVQSCPTLFIVILEK